MSGSRPGERRGGRKKGVPNKFTASLRDAIMQALDRAGGRGGAVAYLSNLAKERPEIFCALLAKLLPVDLKNAFFGAMPLAIEDKGGERVEIVVSIPDATQGEDRSYREVAGGKVIELPVASEKKRA
jgi:hypothetical protein